MISKREIVSVVAVGIVLAFTISLLKSWTAFFIALGAILLVMVLNITAKKLASYYFDSEINIKIWEIERGGYRSSWRFKRSFPAGVFFPILLTGITAGYATWLAPLVFDIKAKVYRAAKRHGVYSFSEMTEFHIGLIAAAGIAINLIVAIIGYFLGFPLFSKLNIYYALFNMIPWADLDGNKIFFGNLTLWCFLATVTLIGVGYALFII